MPRGPKKIKDYLIKKNVADALKLLVKEIIIPRQSNSILFIIGPCITLVFALLGWAIIPFGEGLAIFDYSLGVFFALAVSSIGSYGILISGWAANSKYTFLGAIRSTAQLLSYELVFSSIVLILILFTGSLSLTYIVECQQAVWNLFPLLPIALAFFIAILAETNRAPFDLPEAESELVAGFMSEHSASVFVFFFLGEYSSLVLMSTFMSIFFLGGHHCPDIYKLIIDPFIYVYSYFYNSETVLPFTHAMEYTYLFFSDSSFWNALQEENRWIENLSISPEKRKELEIGIPLIIQEGTMNPITQKDIVFNFINIFIDKIRGAYILGFKVIIVAFLFIWVRASFPRLRYDQLMSLCWKELLPLVFAYIIFVICLFYTFDMMPFGNNF
jgi:NADH-ubiquinone oxidoreductase chain 1